MTIIIEEAQVLTANVRTERSWSSDNVLTEMFVADLRLISNRCDYLPRLGALVFDEREMVSFELEDWHVFGAKNKEISKKYGDIAEVLLGRVAVYK